MGIPDVISKWELELLLIALIAVAAAPDRYFVDPVELCPFLWWGGCPTCGVTRAAHALLNGDIVVAWNTNPAAFPAITIVASRVGSLARARFLGTASPSPWLERILLGAFLALGALNWVGR